MLDHLLRLIFAAEILYIAAGLVCVMVGVGKPRRPGRLLKRAIRPTKRSRSRTEARISYLRSTNLEQDAEKIRHLEKHSLAARGFDWSGLLLWLPFIYLAAISTIAIMCVDTSAAGWQQATKNLIALEFCCLIVILDSLGSRRKVSRDKVITAGLEVLDQCARVARPPSEDVGATSPLGQLRRKVRHYRWNLLYHGTISTDLGGLSGDAWGQARTANRLLKSIADKLLSNGAAEAEPIARVVYYQISQVALQLPENLIPPEFRGQIEETQPKDISLPPIRLVAGGILLIMATSIMALILTALGAGSAMTAAGTLTVPMIGFWLTLQRGPRPSDLPAPPDEGGE